MLYLDTHHITQALLIFLFLFTYKKDWQKAYSNFTQTLLKKFATKKFTQKILQIATTKKFTQKNTLSG